MNKEEYKTLLSLKGGRKMKKVLIYIAIFIVFIFSYLLQSNFFSWFNIAGVKPNLFIILVLFCGLFTGKKSGLIIGVVFGILLDLFLQTSVIIDAIMLGILGFSSGILAKNFSKENKLNIMIMVVLSTLIYETGTYIWKMIIYSVSWEILPFINIILIEMLYNAMLTIILYPIIQYFGQKIEDKLFGNKILRYF